MCNRINVMGKTYGKTFIAWPKGFLPTRFIITNIDLWPIKWAFLINYIIGKIWDIPTPGPINRCTPLLDLAL